MSDLHWLDPAEVVHLTEAGTNAHRVCSGDHSWIERFGHTAVISVKNPSEADELAGEFDRWCEEAGLEVERLFVRYLVRQPREKDQPMLLRGREKEHPKEIIQESGLSYAVDFATGYSVGLFCDQRFNRLRLRALAPKRVLNTFAYTCAFSVAAAAVGAETLSVDLSKSSLNRGRRNLELNGYDLKGHRFIADDVLSVLPRLAQRGEKYDAIILDPPTFGRSSPKRSFKAERDFEELIEMALACSQPGANILLSTNCLSLHTAKLRSMGARVARGKAEFFSEPTQPDFGADHGSATVWLKRK